ncbi:MAG: hypothetical protein HC923_08950, partial [Myxococcales bacterium]|nr:hypothetical protein [Myxococcales bacterium]
DDSRGVDPAAAERPFGDLAERLQTTCSEALMKTLSRAPFADEVRVFNLSKQAKPEAPLYRIEEVARPEALRHVLDYVFVRIKTKSNTAFSPTDLEKKMRGKAGHVLKQTLQAALAEDDLPTGFGAVARNGTTVIFRMADMATGRGSRSSRLRREDPAARQRESEGGASDFSLLFDQAFERLDAAGRRLNHVKLLHLREALPQFDRSTFDAELRKLRLARRYYLNPSEGTHGPLTEEERNAGIFEAGSRLVYCQRAF